MKLGILSDTHNHLGNLKRALDMLRAAHIKTIIHCGDISTPQTAVYMAGFHVIYTYGNTDMGMPAIRQQLQLLNPDNVADFNFSGVLDGVPVAATHSHLPGIVQELVQSQQYAYVFHGHTHRRRDEMVGKTRIINPGALGGTRHEHRSICIVDLSTGSVQFEKIADW